MEEQHFYYANSMIDKSLFCLQCNTMVIPLPPQWALQPAPLASPISQGLNNKEQTLNSHSFQERCGLDYIELG